MFFLLFLSPTRYSLRLASARHLPPGGRLGYRREATISRLGSSSGGPSRRSAPTGIAYCSTENATNKEICFAFDKIGQWFLLDKALCGQNKAPGDFRLPPGGFLGSLREGAGSR